MNVRPYTVTCDVCGGEGVATGKTFAAAWYPRGGVIAHDNPTVCIENLQQKAEAQKTQQAVCA